MIFEECISENITCCLDLDLEGWEVSSAFDCINWTCEIFETVFYCILFFYV